MSFIFIVTLVFLNLLFFVKYNNLLYVLILLELVGFVVLMSFIFSFSSLICSYSVVMLFFVLFVIEGVLGIVGLVLLLSYSGVDYLGLSSQCGVQ